MDSSLNNRIIIGILSGLGIIYFSQKVIKSLFEKSSNKPKKTISFEIGGTNIRVMINDKNNISFESLINSIEGLSNVKDFKTKDIPEETISDICKWVKNLNLTSNMDDYSVGVSMFGPINLAKDSENYGRVLNTPKPGWTNFHLINSLSRNLGVKTNQIFIELDVNCAAFLEYKFGNHKVNSLAYITIGTGVGVGLMIGGKINKGLEGPEGGHIRVKRHELDTFEGNCPFHKDCLEGLIANGAIKKRKNLNTVDECRNIDSNDEIWDFIAYYLAQLCLSLLLLPSVEKIIIGGGIANRESMLKKTREHFFNLNNNYVINPKLTMEGLNQYITRTEFLNNSGILSAYSIIN